MYREQRTTKYQPAALRNLRLRAVRNRKMVLVQTKDGKGTKLVSEEEFNASKGTLKRAKKDLSSKSVSGGDETKKAKKAKKKEDDKKTGEEGKAGE